MAQTDPGPGGPDAAIGRPRTVPAAPPHGDGRIPPGGASTSRVTEATLAELIGRIVNDLSDLVDKQIELAKQEIREDVGEVAGAARTLAIGAAILAGVGLLLLIWAWTAFIWFFNWLGSLLWSPYGGVLGWLLGLLLPALVALLAYQRFVRRGFRAIRITPLERTRATLKEDLEWVRRLRTPSAR